MTFNQGEPVLFMKVGTHAQESLDEIFARKRREIDEAGFTLWGYGGGTCHPTNMVQPFARAAGGQPIVLAMKAMNSKHFADPLPAAEFSADGLTWQEVPEAIKVLGSRFALCIRDLERVEQSLDLAATRVAVGNSKGRIGSEYIQGRVDKACLEVAHLGSESNVVDIDLVATIIEPHAVFLR